MAPAIFAATPALLLLAALVVSVGPSGGSGPRVGGAAFNATSGGLEPPARGTAATLPDPWWARRLREAPHTPSPDQCLPDPQSSPSSPSDWSLSDWSPSELSSSSSSSSSSEWSGSDPLSVGGGVRWSQRVCGSTRLDERVRALLAASPCPQHRVCQTLSPRDLQRIGSDELCASEVRRTWWHRFHEIRVQLREFDAFVLNAFNMREFSVSHEVEQCQAAYRFWKCSRSLPLYLTPHASPSSQTRHESVRVEGCDAICKEVERACPFLIMGYEEDRAAGNPAFTCKDESMPTVLADRSHASPCCYEAVRDPAPGSWLSINATSVSGPGLCVEPDSLLAPAPAPLSCAALTPPSPELRVAPVPPDVWRAWRHHHADASWHKSAPEEDGTSSGQLFASVATWWQALGASIGAGAGTGASANLVATTSLLLALSQCVFPVP